MTGPSPDRAGSRDRPIQLRAPSVSHLFHTLDPYPFRERDLDAGVEEYIVTWAGEFSRSHPISILIHLPPSPAGDDATRHLGEAFRNYFAYRADMLGCDLRALFRTGRLSLVIGLTMLAACLLLGRLLREAIGPGDVSRIVQEGLIILGWVANWRPIEIVLYDWWPIAARRKLYRRLAQAKVTIVNDDPADPAPPVGQGE